MTVVGRFPCSFALIPSPFFSLPLLFPLSRDLTMMKSFLSALFLFPRDLTMAKSNVLLEFYLLGGHTTRA